MNKVLLKINILLFIIFVILFSFQHQSSAYTYLNDSEIYVAANDLGIDTSQYKPPIQTSDKMNSMVEIILGALQIIGAFAIVLGIAVTGFQILVGSAGDKAEGKGKAIGFIIGAIMLFSVTTIAKLVISTVE